MFNHAALKSCLLLTVLILAATDVAQAKIIRSEPVLNTAPSLADPQALQTYLNKTPLDQAKTPAELSETITLNFGPLHFQEVIKHLPKACPT